MSKNENEKLVKILNYINPSVVLSILLIVIPSFIIIYNEESIFLLSTVKTDCFSFRAFCPKRNPIGYCRGAGVFHWHCVVISIVGSYIIYFG